MLGGAGNCISPSGQHSCYGSSMCCRGQCATGLLPHRATLCTASVLSAAPRPQLPAAVAGPDPAAVPQPPEVIDLDLDVPPPMGATGVRLFQPLTGALKERFVTGSVQELAQGHEFTQFKGAPAPSEVGV